MKIVQFGLHYSPNVGDGIIAECLGHAITELCPGATCRTVDLSGRSGFGAVVVRNRELALKVLGLLPASLRGRLVEARLARMLNRVAPDWQEAAEWADLAILGGGQIFSDADLNFCTKIAQAVRVLSAADCPVVVHAAGVSANWSKRGTALFETLFDADLRAVGLRDAASISAWRSQTGDRPPAPILTRDPGLLACDCYGPSTPSESIALGVTAPHILRYHADDGVAGDGGLGFFADLAVELIRRGHDVRLFCNGASEDRRALARVAGMARLGPLIAGGRITCAVPPECPADLAAILSGARGVIAHRLHACIVAYSYGRAMVGLGWDRKLESFFASVDATPFFVGAGQVTPALVAERADAALAAGVDAERHAQVLDETRRAIAALLEISAPSAAASPAAG